MTSRTSAGFTTIDDPNRYWLLVNAGIIHHIGWDDGERLLRLCASVRSGLSLPQSFTFLPRGKSLARDRVTVQVRPDEPIELITEYEHAGQPRQSNWFG